MNMITLQNPSQSEVTILSNTFIDKFMPEANGEFVKVYIYLLRTLSHAPVSFSLEQMADRLICTERDILRALKYWAKLNILSLDFESGKKLRSITILPLNNRSVQAESKESAEVTVTQEQPVPEKPAPPASIKLTPERVSELKQNEEIVQLLYIAEQYLSKTLTPTEMQKILYFYDGLKFSADLIEYLIEYCVSRNHKSIRYIETVALAWAKESITTVEQAKDSSSRYSKEYFSILKAMGITGRNPVETEIAIIDRWIQKLGFSLDIIQEACNRTVIQTGQASFQYADKILSGWHKKSVQSLEDIRHLDAEHQKRKQEKSTPKPVSTAPNRFNNFQQRTYDFDEYEKRLLNQ